MSGQQFDLWHNPSLDVTLRVKAALRDALTGCPLSREAVADKMSQVAKREGLSGEERTPVSPDMLDKWCSASAQHRIPLHYLIILCHVTKSFLPIEAALAPLRAKVVTGDDLDLLELARIREMRDELTRQEKSIKSRRKKR